MGLYGPKYGWLFPGWYSGGWWEKYPSVGCSPAQLAAALDGYIAFDSSSLNPNDHIGVAGITSAQFKLAFDRLVDDLSAVGVIEAPLAYDAIWAVALALNRSQQEFLEIGGLKYIPQGFNDILYHICNCLHNIILKFYTCNTVLCNIVYSDLPIESPYYIRIIIIMF